MIHCIVLGCNGQLGMEFAVQLRKTKYGFTCLSKSSLDVTDITKARDELFYRLDKSYTLNAVINCTAYNSVDHCDLEQAMAVNALGPRNLANLCREEKLTLVHFSTDYVFGDTPDRSIFGETMPLNSYGRSKLRGEQCIRDMYDEHVIIRTGHVFSSRRKNSNPLYRLYKMLTENETVSLVSDQKFQMTHADTLVEFTLALLLIGDCGTFHMVDNEITSLAELGQEIKDFFKLPCRIVTTSASNFSPADGYAQRPVVATLDCFPYKKFQNNWKDKAFKILAEWIDIDSE